MSSIIKIVMRIQLEISEINQPPNYFDISIVSNNAILHNNEVTPYTKTSKAEINRDMKGVFII